MYDSFSVLAVILSRQRWTWSRQLGGRETLLNHPATALQHPTLNGWRTTMWMAPDLGCFALRITTEEKRPDGTYRLVSEKRALKVNLNP